MSYTTTIKFQNGTVITIVSPDTTNVHSITTEVKKRGDDSTSDRDAKQIIGYNRRIREKKVKKERRTGQERRKGLPVPEHMHVLAERLGDRRKGRSTKVTSKDKR